MRCSTAATAVVEPTTVIDLAVSPPVVVRVGKGPVAAISGAQRP